MARMATLGDVPHIARIAQDAFETPWSLPMLRAAILNFSYDVRVLRDAADGVLGFFVAHTVLSESNLDILAVDGPVRGNGYGTHLLNTWIDLSREKKLRGLVLQVNTKNAGAIKLYIATRFRKTRRIEGYYPNKDDAFEMKRSLRTAPPGRAG